MKCFIFAAGMGSRMGMLSKPLLPIGKETVVSRLIRQCGRYWTNDITVGLGYKADEVRAECEKVSENLKFVINPNYATTSMLQTLLYAKEDFECEDVFYVLHGDTVMSDEIFSATRNKPKGMTVVGKKYHPHNDSGIISFEGNQLEAMERELIERPTMGDDTFAVLSRQYGWELYRIPADGFFFNINTWETYQYIQESLGG